MSEVNVNVNTIDAALEEAELISDPFAIYTRKSILNSAVWSFLNNLTFVWNAHLIAYKNNAIVPVERIKEHESKCAEQSGFLNWALSIVRSEDDVPDPLEEVQRFIQRQTEPINSEEDNLTIKYMIKFKKVGAGRNAEGEVVSAEERAQEYLKGERESTLAVLSEYKDRLVSELTSVIKSGIIPGNEWFEPTLFQMRSVVNTLIRQCDSQIDWNLDKMAGSSGKFKLNLMAECDRIDPLLEGCKKMLRGIEAEIEIADSQTQGDVGDEEDKMETDEQDLPNDPQTEDGVSFMQRMFRG